MMYVIFMHTLFLFCTLFVGVLVGAVVWDGARQVINKIKETVLDALELVQIFRA